MAPNQEKILTALGSEFGENTGKSAIIVMALCSLNSSGASLAQGMRKLGYQCDADPDLWMKAE